MVGLSRDLLIDSWMARSEAETWAWIQRYRAACMATDRTIGPVASAGSNTITVTDRQSQRGDE